VDTINQAVGQNAGTLVDALVDEAINMAPLPAPIWADWTNANYPEDDDARRQLRNQQQSEFKLAYANGMLNLIILKLLLYYDNFLKANTFLTMKPLELSSRVRLIFISIP